MRTAIILGALLIAGCKREPDFDERYAAAQRQLEAKSAGIDRDIATGSSDPASAGATQSAADR